MDLNDAELLNDAFLWAIECLKKKREEALDVQRKTDDNLVAGSIQSVADDYYKWSTRLHGMRRHLDIDGFLTVHHDWYTILHLKKNEKELSSQDSNPSLNVPDQDAQEN